jgi:hypothetical protein
MLTQQADLIFGIDDDLAYDRFRNARNVLDDTMQAASIFARVPPSVPNGPPGAALKRQSQGHLSWMATLAPKLERLPTAIQAGGTAIPTFEDRYVLSIVVFYDRPTQLLANGTYPASEWSFTVPAANFYGGGIGGGDIRLADTSTVTPEERIRRLTIHRDQWIMLLSYTSIADPNPMGSGQTRVSPLCRWYRVIDADEVDTTNYTVDVTLSGADWENTGQTIYAVVCQGAVAVFEKTIKLEPRS